jgi:hypothetical protein
MLISQGRAVDLAISYRPLTMEARVQSQPSPCDICGGQRGTGTGVSPSTVHRFFPVGVISAVPYAPLFLNIALVGRKSRHTLETLKQRKAEKHFEIVHSRLDRAE